MAAWGRRLVIANALEMVRSQLASSIKRFQKLHRGIPPADDYLPPAAWTAGREISRAQMEQSILAIDIFSTLRAFIEAVREDVARAGRHSAQYRPACGKSCRDCRVGRISSKRGEGTGMAASANEECFPFTAGLTLAILLSRACAADAQFLHTCLQCASL